MPPFRLIFVTTLLLSGCASDRQQPAVTLTPAAEYAVKKGYASRADISAAVLAARRSKYFPGTDRYEVGTVSQKQIDILYYDVRGTRVIVRRVRGRWEAVDCGFWQS